MCRKPPFIRFRGVGGNKSSQEMNGTSLNMLLDVINQGFDRQSWHGPNLRGSIRGVTYRQAMWRPQPDRHNLWEMCCAPPIEDIRCTARSSAKSAAPSQSKDQIRSRQDVTAVAWRRDVQLLVNTHKSMRASIADVPSTRLHKQLPGAKVTYFFLISGIAAHDVYHAGQIQLLKRLQQ